MPANPPHRAATFAQRELGAPLAHRPKMAELHRRAEARLRKLQQTRNPKQGDASSNADPRRQLHELEVRQIELGMQNAELQEVRERTEALLEKYTDLYDFAPVAYFTLGPDGTIHHANLAGARLVGIERARLVGRCFAHLISVQQRSVFKALLKQVFAGQNQQADDFLLSNEARAARSVVIEARGSLNRQECRAMVIDITERKQAEEKVRRSEALSSTLIARAPYGVYVVDTNLRVQQINRAALRIFRNVPRLIGRELSGVLRLLCPRRVADEITSRFRHTLMTGEPYQSSDLALRRRDTGAQEAYEWQIQRVTLSGGDHAVVAFFNDITERKRAEEIQRHNEVLAASNRKLEEEIVRRHAVEQSLKKSKDHQGQLLAQSRQMEKQLRQLSRKVLRVQEAERKRISRELHDVIAQTLTGINVRLASLKKEAEVNGTGQHAFTHDLARTQEFVAQAVNLVHQFARDLRPSTLDDLGLIPALRSYMTNLQEEVGLRMTLSAFATVEQVREDKRTVLFRVAQEALTNAARHAKASHLDVVIQKVDGAVHMNITDNGKGFRAEQMSRLGKSKRLGLLGMKERLEMVGGSFKVISAPGKGTTVLVQIPMRNRKPDGGRIPVGRAIPPGDARA